MPLSTKFHLYHGGQLYWRRKLSSQRTPQTCYHSWQTLSGQLYWRRKTEFPEKNHRLAAIADKLYHISLVNILMDELPILTVFLSLKPVDWYWWYLVTCDLIQFVRIFTIFNLKMKDINSLEPLAKCCTLFLYSVF